LLAQSAQGLQVATLSQNDIVELYLVREVLVGAAAGQAAQRASVAEVQYLRSILEAFEREQEPSQLKAVNAQFHKTLYDISHNSYLVKTLQSLTNSIDLLPGTTLAWADGSRRPLDEHRAIVDAIERRDAAGAEAIAREHIRNSLRIRFNQPES
jgi:DNA-binding GntR family transcriptional regulator